MALKASQAIRGSTVLRPLQQMLGRLPPVTTHYFVPVRNESSGGNSGSEKPSSSDSKPKSKLDPSKGPQPKILNENPPGEKDESVRKHNEELEQRHERAEMRVHNEEAGKDKVPPGYWKGKEGEKQ